MTNPTSNPPPMSIIMTTRVPEEMNNTTIAVASPSDVGTTSNMQSTPSTHMTTDLSVTQETACRFKAFASEKEPCRTHTPKLTFMVDWKRTKSSHVWNNIVLINCEKLMVVIKKAISEDNNREVTHDEFSVKSFLQSDGGITGLLSIKTALEELEESLKGKTCKCRLLSNSYRLMELMQSLALSKFCLNCKSISLQDSVLELYKGAISNVTLKNIENCQAIRMTLLNKKKTLESSFSMTKQKEHA